MLVQLSERCDVQTRDFIFLFLLALIMYLLDISSELSLSEFLNQWEWVGMPQSSIKQAISGFIKIEQ